MIFQPDMVKLIQARRKTMTPYLTRGNFSLVLNSQQPAAEDGGASPAFCATSERNLRREVPAQKDKAARGSPPNNEKTPKRSRSRK
jgi:hypothetical protein